MTIPKIYLETTMFNFYYGQETTPEYRQYKAEARAVFDKTPNQKIQSFPHLEKSGICVMDVVQFILST
jgi:hypothetical protein